VPIACAGIVRMTDNLLLFGAFCSPLVPAEEQERFRRQSTESLSASNRTCPVFASLQSDAQQSVSNNKELPELFRVFSC
jgi:hypothetical protein